MTLTQIWYHMKVHLLEIIICQSVVKLKKPTSRTFSPNRGRVTIFTPGIICSADHSAQKKKLGNYYEKNLAMQDTTNLAALCGVWVGLACCHGNSSGFVILIIIIYLHFFIILIYYYYFNIIYGYNIYE